LLARAAVATASPDCSPAARELLTGLALLAQGAAGETIPAVAHHGDLNSFDILGRGQGFWVTDWEWSTRDGLPFLDLVTLGLVAAKRVSGRDATALPSAVWALIGAGGASSQTLCRSVQEAAEAYCAAVGVIHGLRPALAAATLLHSLTKEWHAGYEGKRYLDPPESNPWVIAARALLAAPPPQRAGSLP